MKHLVLILYFLTFASGAGAIILGSFYYLKKKLILVKYAVLFDLFFAANVLFDTLNLYNTIFKGIYSDLFHKAIMYCLFFAAIGMMYYFNLLTHGITGLSFTKRKKQLYFLIIILCFLIISGLQALSALQLADEGTADHTGFFISNILAVGWVCYNIYKLLTNYSKIDMSLKPAVKSCLAILALIIPTSFLFNIITYTYSFRYPVAFSPIAYLLLNLIAVYQLTRNNPDIFADPKTDDISGMGDSIAVNAGLLSKQYGITEREVEIIKLIVEGQNNQEIGEKLYISPNTVKNHIYNIYRKIGVKNRYELINLLHTTFLSKGTLLTK